MMILAHSSNRYNGGVAAKRKYGSSTLTEFIVYLSADRDDPSKWATITTGGKTPGERKTAAIAEFKRQRGL
jgi:hypothetical protein